MTEQTATLSVRPPANQETLEHAEISIEAPEPWEPFETQLVAWSIGIGIVGLIILGTLVNVYLLD